MSENPLKLFPSLACQSPMHCGWETDLLMPWNVNGQSQAAGLNMYVMPLTILAWTKLVIQLYYLHAEHSLSVKRVQMWIMPYANDVTKHLLIICLSIYFAPFLHQWSCVWTKQVWHESLVYVTPSLCYSLWSKQAGWFSKRLAGWNQLVALKSPPTLGHA